MSKLYQSLEHTADIGFRVLGETLEQLFEHAAFALFDSLSELNDVHEKLQEEVRVQGMDLPELMVNWLNQLLFLWETKLVLFKRFSIQKISDTELAASAWGEKYSSNRHELLTDIKAATYHQLKVEEKEGFWTAEIILDT